MKVTLKIDKKINKDNNFNKKIFIIKEFIKFCVKELNLKKSLTIKLLSKQYSDDSITTGGYDIGQYHTLARFEGRLLSDVLTTIAHELTHQMQDEQGKLNTNNPIPDIGGEIEDEANASAGRLRKSFTLKYNQYRKSIYSLNESYKTFKKRLNESEEYDNEENINENLYNGFVHIDNIELLSKLNDITEIHDTSDITYYYINDFSEVLPFCDDIVDIKAIQYDVETDKYTKPYMVYNKTNNSFALFIQNFVNPSIDTKTKYLNILSTSNSSIDDYDEDSDINTLNGFEIFKMKIKQYDVPKDINILSDEDLYNILKTSIETKKRMWFIKILNYIPKDFFEKNIRIINLTDYDIEFIFKSLIMSCENINVLNKLYEKILVFMQYLINNLTEFNHYFIYTFLLKLNEKNMITVENFIPEIMLSIFYNIQEETKQSLLINTFLPLTPTYAIENLINLVIKHELDKNKKYKFFLAYIFALHNCQSTKPNFNQYIDKLFMYADNKNPILKIFLREFYRTYMNDSSVFITPEEQYVKQKFKQMFIDNTETPLTPYQNENYIREFVKQNIKKLLI